MNEAGKRPKLVGNFIRQRREALGLSQKELGLLFNPSVTTQFISNLERGVTPLPPSHVSTLSKALLISEGELASLLEREYSHKLQGRLGQRNAELKACENPGLAIASEDLAFIYALYDAYRRADLMTRQTFITTCENILNLPKSSSATDKDL